jgi:hypothetical protein
MSSYCDNYSLLMIGAAGWLGGLVSTTSRQSENQMSPVGVTTHHLRPKLSRPGVLSSKKVSTWVMFNHNMMLPVALVYWFLE